MREIILLKSAFSIIDQMFHKEIRDGENKRSRMIYYFIFGNKNSENDNPEAMNEFIKNLMDPFNNEKTGLRQDFDSYYDDYYELYGIDNNTIELTQKEFKLKEIFDPKSYFSKDKSVKRL